MFRFIFIILMVIFYATIGLSQIYLNEHEVDETTNSDTAAFLISRIDIIGNDKTKPEVILRELRFTENQQTLFKELIAAHKRVLSLMLFNRVKFDLVGDLEDCVLIITVYERWYIFPLPLLYRNERSWRKISYGGKLLYYNFLGKNILLNFTSAFGYNPVFKFSYSNPWFLGDLKLFTNLSFYYKKVRSLSPELNEYEDTRTGFDWLIGKRFGHFVFTGINFGYAQLTAPPEIGLTLSEDGKDELPSISVTFQYDNRDLKEYPHKGWYWFCWARRIGKGGEIGYYRYGTDLRKYIPLNTKLTLALRTAVDLADGEIPSYDRVYFGYYERLRGYYYDVFEGENLVFGGAEFRFPIMKIRYIDIETFPQFGDYSSNLKFGISGGLFIETGSVWYQKQSPSIQDFKSGFGGGIHFHLPYIEVFRLELGLNFHWEPSAIAEVEVAF